MLIANHRILPCQILVNNYMTKREYTGLAWFPIAAVGLSMVSFILIKTGRDAVFFKDWGIRKLPLAYIWIAVAAVPAAIMHLSAMNKWGARKARTGIFFAAALLFLLFAPFATVQHNFIMTIMFICVPVIFAGVFAGAWLLAGDLLEGADSSRLRVVYSRIGAASMVGGIIGGLLAKALASHADPQVLVATGAVVLMAVGLLVAKAHKDNPASNYTSLSSFAEKEDSHKSFSSRQATLVRQKYVRILIGISALATITAMLIDFQFYAMTTVAGNNNVQFFANFYIILNLISLAVQVFVAPRLQARLGITGALLLLPSALLGGAGLCSYWTVVHSKTILRVLEGGLKASIYRTMWEQVYLVIGQPFRDAAKSMVDGMVQRFAEGLAALLLLAWFALNDNSVSELNFEWLSWVIVSAIIFWIVLTRRLGKLGCDALQPSEVLIRLPDG